MAKKKTVSVVQTTKVLSAAPSVSEFLGAVKVVQDFLRSETNVENVHISTDGFEVDAAEDCFNSEANKDFANWFVECQLISACRRYADGEEEALVDIKTLAPKVKVG